jgi:pimeloyl-ACP methyl ester carboxylesterase
LTLDFAGFGASADPFATHQPHRVDLELETEAALAYLAGIAPEHKQRIGLVGHSMGADPALRVGLRSSLVGSITLMGPPRRVWERFHAMPDLGFFWNWAIEVGRKQYKRDGFPAWYGKEQWRQDILRRDMALMLPALEDGGHKPVLFIDGGREPDLDREFLDEYVRRVRYPKRYVTLNGVDHNSNVRRQGAHIVYEPAVMEKTVGVLDDWHQAYASGRPTPFDIGRNLLRLLFSGLPVIGGR